MRLKTRLLALVCLCTLLVSGCNIAVTAPAEKQRQQVESLLPDPYSIANSKGVQLKPYYYELLSEDEKIWYDDIVYIISGMQEKTALSTVPIANGMGEESLNKIFD